MHATCITGCTSGVRNSRCMFGDFTNGRPCRVGILARGWNIGHSDEGDACGVTLSDGRAAPLAGRARRLDEGTDTGYWRTARHDDWQSFYLVG